MDDFFLKHTCFGELTFLNFGFVKKMKKKTNC